MSDRLPRDREKALAAIADGTYTGRVATAAHPMCRCGKPKPAQPTWGDVDGLDTYRAALQAWIAEHGDPRFPHYEPRDCPMHRSGR